MAFEHFGVYYKNRIYYLTTNPESNGLRHLVDESDNIQQIKDTKIPNLHRRYSETRHLQGKFKEGSNRFDAVLKQQSDFSSL